MIFRRGIIYGLISGAIVGIFFKWIEFLTGEKVYTLLLNVDFIPTFGMNTPEWLQFVIHLGISGFIGILFAALLAIRRLPWVWGLLLGSLPIPSFYQLAPLSKRTPSIDDGQAFAWWIAGHVLYGCILALTHIIMQKDSDTRGS